MKHRIAFRKLSRTTSHRNLLLRNLVSSLLEHEAIITTVAKAKEAARLAEKVITWGKKGQRQHQTLAKQFLLNCDKTHSKLFQQLAERYKGRAGGYTRIEKFGFREGDHAPRAILQLVDGPRDTRLEMAAREVGRTLALTPDHQPLVRSWRSTEYDPEGFTSEIRPLLHPATRLGMDKALALRSPESQLAFDESAKVAFDRTRAVDAAGPARPNLTARHLLVKHSLLPRDSYASLPTVGYKARAGERTRDVGQVSKRGFELMPPVIKAGSALARAKGLQASTKWQRRRPLVVAQAQRQRLLPPPSAGA